MILYLKSISLGRYLKIKKGRIYNLFNFVQQVWAYCNIKELKNILYYFVFSFAHMCSFSFPPKDYCRRQKQIVFRCTGRPTNSTIFLQSALFHKIQLLPPPYSWNSNNSFAHTLRSYLFLLCDNCLLYTLRFQLYQISKYCTFSNNMASPFTKVVYPAYKMYLMGKQLFFIMMGFFFVNFFSDLGYPRKKNSGFVKKSEIMNTFLHNIYFFINVLLDSERHLKCDARALSTVNKNTKLKNGSCSLIKPTFSPRSPKKHHTIPAEVLPNASEALFRVPCL